MVRKIYENELKDLLELYLHLHESTISEMSEYLSKTWNCVFSTAGHAIDSEQRGQGLEIALPITVGDNVWIGTNVFVLPGVTIGNNTIIGAGSVVNKNIPDGVIAAGNPCKIIRKITDSDKKKYPIFEENHVSGHGTDRVSSRGRGYSANRAGSASARCKSAAAIRI